ncbi:MAG: hypothetical protein M1828_002544 [Chrysothrix sp. TS-e1954]|nr:MAG: hypothetical protein M1828_002544 [Chrysothrix sp. TS-e1954]
MTDQGNNDGSRRNQQWRASAYQQDAVPGFVDPSNEYIGNPSLAWNMQNAPRDVNQHHLFDTFDAQHANGLATQTADIHFANPTMSFSQAETGPQRYDSSGITSAGLEQDFMTSQFGPVLTLADHDSGHMSAPDLGDNTTPPRGGTAPLDRAQLNDEEIPSLEEQEKQRETAKKNTNVQTWLKTSQTDPPPDPSEPRSREPSAPLQGSRSTVSSNHQPPTAYKGAGHQQRPHLTTPKAPGPGVYLKVDEEDEASESGQSEESTTPPAPAAQGDYESYNSYSVPPGEGKDAATQGLKKIKPWDDSPLDRQVDNIKGQPDTSNAAMSRFNQRARDLETASLAATLGSLGSRRRSETDLDSLFSSSGISMRAPTQREPQHDDDKFRRPTLLGRMIPGRSNSNVRKRRDDELNRQTSAGSSTQARKESQGSLNSLSSLNTVKKMGHWGRPKAPSITTSLSHTTSAQSPTSPSNLMPTAPWKSALRRARSRSEMGHVAGIAERWAKQGGPPVPTLNAPSQDDDINIPSPSQAPQQPVQRSQVDAPDADDGESPITPIAMAFSMNLVPVAATTEAFRNHVKQLNPQLMPFMIERITLEQSRRYKRLAEFKINHDKAIKANRCSSGERCTASGGHPKYLPWHSTSRNADGPPVIFNVISNSQSEGPLEDDEGVSSIPATFPEGVPIPPVRRLPAEFECPLCFQVKKLAKPSDWTKHVHEDVQPFTCTFPNCAEPKSFKRKADWVRHENERHRHLEQWICEHQECGHVCYRKDNFIQHLVREHRYPEPRVRSSRLGRGQSTGLDSGTVVTLVEQCRQETSKNPSDEPCRFCENLCNSWKKLTVHLAKHMEQISMPLLIMIDRPTSYNSRPGQVNEWQLGNAQSLQWNGISSDFNQLGIDSTQVSSNPNGLGMVSNNTVYSDMPTSQGGFTYPPAMGYASQNHNQSTFGSSSPYSVSTPNASVYSGQVVPRSVGTASPASTMNHPSNVNDNAVSLGLNTNMPGYGPYEDSSSGYQYSNQNPVSTSADAHHLTAATYPPVSRTPRPSSRQQQAYQQINAQGQGQQLLQDDMISASPTAETATTYNAFPNTSGVGVTQDQTQMSYSQLAQLYASQAVPQYGLQSYSHPQLDERVNATAGQNYDTSQAQAPYMHAYSTNPSYRNQQGYSDGNGGYFNQ